MLELIEELAAGTTYPGEDLVPSELGLPYTSALEVERFEASGLL